MNTKSYWSYNHPLSSWSDIEDRYQRCLIDRKIESRKRLLKLLPYPSKYFRWF